MQNGQEYCIQYMKIGLCWILSMQNQTHFEEDWMKLKEWNVEIQKKIKTNFNLKTSKNGQNELREFKKENDEIFDADGLRIG